MASCPISKNLVVQQDHHHSTVASSAKHGGLAPTKKKLLFHHQDTIIDNSKASYQTLENDLQTALETLIIKDNYIEYLEERLEQETTRKPPSDGEATTADLEYFRKDQEEKWEALISDCWREMFENCCSEEDGSS
jgi:hypothetical protein